jgi:hypothetical protein
MTSNQINICLTSFGITDPMNKWLKPTQFPIIFLDQDSNIFTSDNDELYYFDSTNNILRVAHSVGSYKTITNDASSVSSYPSDRCYDFSIISGFIRSVYCGILGSYYTKSF